MILALLEVHLPLKWSKDFFVTMDRFTNLHSFLSELKSLCLKWRQKIYFTLFCSISPLFMVSKNGPPK